MNMLNPPEFIDAHEQILSARWTASHVNSWHELIYVLEKQLTFECGSVSLNAKKGDILFVPEKSLHKDYFEFNCPPRVLYINFHWSDGGRFFAETGHFLSNAITPWTLLAVKQLISDIRNDHGVTSVDISIANSRLHLLLQLIYRDVMQSSREFQSEKTQLREKHFDIADKVKGYIDDNYQKQFSLDDLSKNMDISPFYLSRIFNNITNLSISEYLNDVRMKKACDLIVAGDYTYDEIAESIGFSCGHYFSKVFKQRFGITPKNYAKLNAEKINGRY